MVFILMIDQFRRRIYGMSRLSPPLERCAVLGRRHAGDRTEGADEGIQAAETDAKADIAQRHPLCDQRLTLYNPAGAKVFGDGGVKILLKQPRNIFPAVVKMCCRFGYRGINRQNVRRDSAEFQAQPEEDRTPLL